jgi:hypothetical protein
LQFFAATHVGESEQEKDDCQSDKNQVEHCRLRLVDVVANFKIKKMISVGDMGIAD